MININDGGTALELVDAAGFTAWKADLTLRFLSVTCRALAGATEMKDGVSSGDKSKAFEGMAVVLDDVRARVADINKAAHGIFDKLSEHHRGAKP